MKSTEQCTTYITKQAQPKLNRLSAHQYERTIQDLVEKIDILESKLKATNVSKVQVVSSYKNLEDENVLLKEEIQQLSKDQSRISSTSTSYASQVTTMKEEIISLKEKYKTKFEIMNRELQQKESEVNKLLANLKERDDKLSYFTVNHAIFVHSSDTFKEDLDRQKAMNKLQSIKINELEKTINDLYMNKQSEGNLLLENEHLRTDNIRLLEMLKTTEEYKDFAFLNLTTPGGIRYVHKEPFVKSCYHACQIARMNETLKQNSESWIPSEAFDLIMNYNMKYQLNFNEKIINDLLANLNNIWKQRENKQTARLKTKYNREIVSLKRQCGIGVEPEKILNPLIKKKPQVSNNSQKINQGKELISGAMKSAEIFNDTKINLEKEINSLRQKITEKDVQLKSKDNKDSKEALSILEKISNEINKMITSFTDLLIQYNERVKDTSVNTNTIEAANHNIKLIHNSVRWLFNSLQEIVHNIKSIVTQWKKELTNGYT